MRPQLHGCVRKALEHLQKQTARDTQEGRRRQCNCGGRPLGAGEERVFAQERAAGRDLGLLIGRKRLRRQTEGALLNHETCVGWIADAEQDLARSDVSSLRPDGEDAQRRATEHGKRRHLLKKSDIVLDGHSRHQLVPARVRYEDRWVGGILFYFLAQTIDVSFKRMRCDT